MSQDSIVIAGAGLAQAARRSRWPARLDLTQSLSGLVLALFMWAHMLLVSSILLGKDVMWTVARVFEGYYLFGVAHPVLVSCAVGGVMLLIMLHAALALRKFPASYAQLTTFRDHMRLMRHPDTSLWLAQVVTGFLLFFLAFVHLYLLLVRPDRIGPYASSDRVWSEHLWPLYLVLLVTIEVHSTVGLYRLCVKWGWPAGASQAITRQHLQMLRRAITVIFLALGAATLAAYIQIGVAHQAHRGERYTPAWVLPAQAPSASPP